jgi:hypothetical protein
LQDISLALPPLISESVNSRIKLYVGGPMAHFAPEQLGLLGTQVLSHNALKTVEVVTEDVLAMARQFDLTQRP